ncbi:hypothetical protein TWF730_007338 [Orbilia blumenaviensis]|uniref:Odorant receptor n=1 Tax=Orbilia blumenaviensis TaxID=1796055 RepID=A0AAV9V840_9PEZI
MILSYAPLALYADSLRVNSALVAIVGSRLAIPSPITGCIKDLSRIWNLSSLEILSNYSTSRGASVSSVRHGNTFPLMNEAFLEGSSLIGRGDLDPNDSELEFSPQRARVHITYIMPTTAMPNLSSPSLWSWIITVVEILTLVTICSGLVLNGITIGAVPMCCLIINTILLFALQHTTRLIFANKTALEKDISLTVAGGAALDAHIITKTWSSPDIDVIIGYSSQLHSLTNIPIRISNWKIVRYISRLIILVLIIQATTLASLFNGNSNDVWGSAVWMICYLLMLVPPALVSRLNPDMLLDAQPSVARRLPPIGFSRRKAALVFIGTLPGIERRFEVGRWDYMDSFMPNNKRRDSWLQEITTALAKMDSGNNDFGKAVSNECRGILEQVKSARENMDYKLATEVFKQKVGIYRVKLDA